MLMWGNRKGGYTRIFCMVNGRLIVLVVCWIMACMLRHELPLDSLGIL